MRTCAECSSALRRLEPQASIDTKSAEHSPAMIYLSISLYIISIYI